MPKSNQMRRTILFLFSLWVSLIALAQTNEKAEQVNEITIFAIPTLMPLNWESPSALYKSMNNCYLKTMFERDNYLLGHIAVELNTPLLSKPLLLAMTSSKPQEKVDLIIKQKVGLGIMGAAIQGRIETEKELIHKLNVYAKRNKLAFITYRINEKAASRILQFIDYYSGKTDSLYAPCKYYGGAFWPRYKNEGAGCSAFGMALLDVANLLTPESEKWLIQVDIPINIIGGEFNNHKKINPRTISRTKHWYSGQGLPNRDFVTYKVYEPSVMFEWIMKKREDNDSKFTPIEKDGVPGLLIDLSTVQTPDDEPLFKERTEYNLFVDKHVRKLKATSSIN